MEAKLERSGADYAVRLSADDVRALGLSEGQTVEVLPKAAPSGGTEAAACDPSRRVVNGVRVLTLAEMIAEMDRLGPSHRPDLVDWGPDVGAEILRDDY